MTSSSDWRLYVILDPKAARGRNLAILAEAAIRGGADVLQLRDKSGAKSVIQNNAQEILHVSRKAQIPLIINDHADVAGAVGADGVHLGQEDGLIVEARKQVGSQAIIGRSTHSLKQALQAQEEGADYIGFGPIFPTPTKPDYGSIGLKAIQAVHDQVSLPIVCIGGIDAQNIEQVMRAQGRCVAVVRAVCSAEDPESATRDVKVKVEQFYRSQ